MNKGWWLVIVLAVILVIGIGLIVIKYTGMQQETRGDNNLPLGEQSAVLNSLDNPGLEDLNESLVGVSSALDDSNVEELDYNDDLV